MTIVFDAEPLIAHAFDEPGADVVSEYLTRVSSGKEKGVISTVNITELQYVCHRYSDGGTTEKYLNRLEQAFGVEVYGTRGVWKLAAGTKFHFNVALGDAFAVATADQFVDWDAEDGAEDVTLLVGADDDYDEIIEHGEYNYIERFRDESV